MIGTVEQKLSSEVELRPKKLQGISQLLNNIGEIFPEAPDLILLNAQTYRIPMLRFEIVRKERGKWLTSTDATSTGFEGILAGCNYSPDTVRYTIAKTAEEEFYALTKHNPAKRQRLEKVLFECNYSDLKALKWAEQIFLLTKIRLYNEHVINNPHSQVKALYDIFRGQTTLAAFATPSPELIYNSNSGSFFQNIIVPYVETQVPQQANIGIPFSKDGDLIAKELGIVGHPVLRSCLSFEPLIQYFEMIHPREGVNYAFKGSRVREMLINMLAYRFLEQVNSDRDYQISLTDSNAEAQ